MLQLQLYLVVEGIGELWQLLLLLMVRFGFIIIIIIIGGRVLWLLLFGIPHRFDLTCVYASKERCCFRRPSQKYTMVPVVCSQSGRNPSNDIYFIYIIMRDEQLEQHNKDDFVCCLVCVCVRAQNIHYNVIYGRENK